MLPTVGFSPATTVEFIAAANSRTRAGLEERLRALETAVAVLASNRYASAKGAAGVRTIVAAIIAAVAQFFGSEEQ